MVTIHRPARTTNRAVESLRHEEARRSNIPMAEYQSVLQQEEQAPVRVAYEWRNRDLDLLRLARQGRPRRGQDSQHEHRVH